MAKHRKNYVTVTCEAECYLDEFDTDDLIAELKARNRALPAAEKSQREELCEIRELIAAGRIQDALIEIDYLIFPKFKSLEGCMEALAKARTPAN